MSKQHVYLDNAAATSVDPLVVKAMLPYLSERFYNPSATYEKARQVSVDIEAARANIAYWLGAKPTEIIFTAGGTEANNLAIDGVMSRYPKANLVVSAIEHESVLLPAQKYNYHFAPVSQDGLINIEKLSKLINDETVLVSIIYANNEIGTVQPLTQIAKLIKEIKNERNKKGNKLPLYFHTDACQAPAYLDLHTIRLGIDLMTLNGGKIYGPKQSGVLYINRLVELTPQILGGGQESSMRSGTENVAGIIGFAAAIDLVQKRRKAESERLTKLRNNLINELKLNIPGLSVNGSMVKRLPNNLHVSIDGQDNERLLMRLDQLGVMCSAGSACHASDRNISATLRAIGLSAEVANSSLRFSMGKNTETSDLKYLVKSLKNSLD
jgi:cysteine desulfurase